MSLMYHRFVIEDYTTKIGYYIKRANLTEENNQRRAAKSGIYHCTATNGGITVTESIEMTINCGNKLVFLMST